MPSLWVVAGPNGVGKSSLLADKWAKNIPVITPDTILATGQAETLVDAGRQAIRERNKLLTAGHTFIVETTFTGSMPHKLLGDAKHAGFTPRLIFLGANDPEILIGRVSNRVTQGGHNVLVKDQVRRYSRSMINFTKYASEFEQVIVVDASTVRRKYILGMKNGRVRHAAKALPKWYKSAEPPKIRKARKIFMTKSSGLSI